MNWIIDHIEYVVPGMIVVLGLIGVLTIWASHILYKDARMLHENEPLEPREWKPADWKPLNEMKK